MIIHCPHCGKRYSGEFSYEGDASIKRPTGEQQKNNENWYNYIYARKNEVENHKELWHHINGCRQYIVVTRNLRSHEIIKIQTVADFQSLQNTESLNNTGSKDKQQENL